MNTWKILITDGLEDNGQSVLRKSAHVDDKNGISPDELVQVICEYNALIVRGRTKVTAAVLGAGKQLKVVGRSGVGVDNIDLEAAKQNKITVVNAPVATTIAVAELTMSLMLSMLREIPRADASMKAGKWIKKELEGIELYQKVLGVIGFGRIGTAVAQRAMAFGMNVIGYDPIIQDAEIFKQGATPVSLADLFIRADIITMHIPLTPVTRNIINAEAISTMKSGVRIVCAARGGVIDEEAILAGLDSGIISSVALDVFATEPPGLTALVSHPRVICTPHIGAQTIEAQQRAAADISSEVLAALKGESLRWKVA
jgi:D-3-phosphoglycerate dehydrogenase